MRASTWALLLVCNEALSVALEVTNVTHSLRGPDAVISQWGRPDGSSPTAAAQARFEKAIVNSMYIVRASCDLMDNDLPHPRAAPLVFADLGGVIMQTTTLFVLDDANVSRTSVTKHWVPLSLARHAAREDPETLANLDALSAYDFWITVNSHMGDGYRVGDSDCDFTVATDAGDQYYSAPSVLLHEVLHGMGISSMLATAASGGTNGFASIMDSLIRDDHGAELIGAVTPPSAESVAGLPLTIMGHSLFNPTPHLPGSSLSHFVGSGVMSSTIGHSTCRLELTDAVVDTLVGMGWQCVRTNNTHTWDEDYEYITSEALGGHASPFSDGDDSLDASTSTALWISGSVVAVVILIIVWLVRSPPPREYAHLPSK